MAAHQPQPEDFPDADEAAPSNGCGCFRLFGLGFHRSADYEGINLLRPEESWVARKLKRVKEASEIVAGPKWKTFVRKMGGFFMGKKKKNRFQYDPESYALNFDGGFDGEDDGPPLGFSARFALPTAAREQH